MARRLSLRAAPSRRPGGMTPFVLVGLVVFLALLGLAVNYLHLAGTHLEMQTAAEAGALAGAHALVDDRLLLTDAATLHDLLRDAATAATSQAAANVVYGRSLSLRAEDVTFGHLEHPRSRDFIPLEAITSQPIGVNVVRIRALLTRERGNPIGTYLGELFAQPTFNSRAFATALFDRDVIGFRSWGSPPIPMVPLAIHGQDWETQMEQGSGSDQQRYDPETRSFVFDPDGDGLPEMELVLPLDPNDLPAANVAFLNVGANDGWTVARQVLLGLQREHVAAVGGELILDENQRLPLPGEAIGPAPLSPDAVFLRQGLELLRQTGEARVWPLQTGLDPVTGHVVVTRFVAARIVAVGPLANNQPLRVVVQPSVLSTSTAVTDAARRLAGTAQANPYVGKVRVVE